MMRLLLSLVCMCSSFKFFEGVYVDDIDTNGLTALRVGFPLKKGVFSRFLGGSSWGFRKKHPWAMASRGAGPS